MRGCIKFIQLMSLATISTCMSAGENFVFRIPLGVKLQIPECSKKAMPRGRRESYRTTPPTTACFEYKTTVKLGSVKVDDITIRFPDTDLLSLAPEGELNCVLMDGNLESIQFCTGGAGTRDRDLETLTKKYGKPAEIKWANQTIGFGANEKTVTATWKSNKLFVYFQSYDESVDIGTVRIETDKGHSLQMWRENETAKNVRPL